MIALAFLAGYWFGVLVGIGVVSLCRAAAHGESGLDATLAEIRALPEVTHHG